MILPDFCRKELAQKSPTFGKSRHCRVMVHLAKRAELYLTLFLLVYNFNIDFPT